MIRVKKERKECDDVDADSDDDDVVNEDDDDVVDDIEEIRSIDIRSGFLHRPLHHLGCSSDVVDVVDGGDVGIGVDVAVVTMTTHKNSHKDADRQIQIRPNISIPKRSFHCQTFSFSEIVSDALFWREFECT